MAMTSIVPGNGNGNNDFNTQTTTTTQSTRFSFLKDINTIKSNNLPGKNNNNNNNVTTPTTTMFGPSPGRRNPATKSGTFHGRKFIESGDKINNNNNDNVNVNDSSSRTKGKKMNSNINDLDKLLDNDAVALLNMRKDLSHAQEQEVEKARNVLTNLQKECDNIKILNLQKDHEVNKYEDQKKVLIGLVKSQNENTGKYTHTIEVLNDEIMQVEENILAENRTKTVLLFMIKRLEDEIIECKSNSHHWTQLLQQTKAELGGLDSTLRLSKHELSNDEKQVELLSKTVKGRNEQRLNKMNELQSLVLEGESSVMRIKQTLKGSLDTIPTSRKHDDFEHFAKGDTQKNHGLQDRPGSGNNPTEAYELTKEQIHEIIERYNSRLQLIEKLNSIQIDLNGQIRDQKQKKINYDDLLEKSNQKLQLLASNRQIYQEVDMKDAALSTARKEGDDCRERDQRLRKGIEGLRRSIPRFLQKVNKDLIPEGGKPVTVDQLPDVVHKLDDEINKLIKLISERMMKDATPEDISNMSNSVQEYNNMQTTETTLSETSRLHKLPGYHRLQKQLFYNLMSAVPDSSEKNIRVQTINILDSHADDNHRGTNLTQDSNNISNDIHNKRGNNINGGIGGGNNNNNNNHDVGMIGSGNDYIDRATIKNISKLVVTQKEKNLQNNNMNNTMNNSNGYKRFGNTKSR